MPVTEDAVRGALEEAQDNKLFRSVNLTEPVNLVVDTANGTVGLSYRPGVVLGETDILTIGSDTSYSAMRRLFANPNVHSVSIELLTEWTDEYGTVTEARSVYIRMSRETADRISWDGFKSRVQDDEKHIFCIADEHYIHPAIMGELFSKGCLVT